MMLVLLFLVGWRICVVDQRILFICGRVRCCFVVVFCWFFLLCNGRSMMLDVVWSWLISLSICLLVCLCCFCLVFFFLLFSVRLFVCGVFVESNLTLSMCNTQNHNSTHNAPIQPAQTTITTRSAVRITNTLQRKQWQETNASIMHHWPWLVGVDHFKTHCCDYLFSFRL